MTERRNFFVGWDLGGAHLKVAGIGAGGAILRVEQHATPIWEGLTVLDAALSRFCLESDRAPTRHALTMSGELVDAFVEREQGVRALLDLFCRRFPPESVRVYALDSGLQPVDAVLARPLAVASANWHATATYVAETVGDGILVDIGSTTTDIIPFREQRPCHLGATDMQRLRCGELVYTGVVRTPVMALIQRAPFAGVFQNIAAERFATTADVYRVTDELDEACDLYPPADGAGKSRIDSIRRLARMLGTDAGTDVPDGEWRGFAEFIAARQLELIQRSFDGVRNRVNAAHRARRLVGAGSGRFLARKLAEANACEYIDFAQLVAGEESARAMASVCAPAVVVAQLARRKFRA